VFVTGHIGKLGTGSADKCKTTIYGIAIDARRLFWKIEINGEDILGYFGENPVTISSSGIPLSVYNYAVLTDTEIIVIENYEDPDNPIYTPYEYYSQLGKLSAFHANSPTFSPPSDDSYSPVNTEGVQAYAATSNGDIYMFDSTLAEHFTFVTNYGKVLACFCDFFVEGSEYKQCGYILNENGELYALIQNNPYGLVHSNVTGLGSLLEPYDYDIYSESIGCIYDGYTAYQEMPVFSDENGDVYSLSYNSSAQTVEKNLLASGVSAPVIGYIQYPQGDDYICCYLPYSRTLIGGRVTGWTSPSCYIPIMEAVNITCDKPYVANFDFMYPVPATEVTRKYLIGAADRSETYYTTILYY